MFNWIKENPKKSIGIAVVLATVGGTYMMFGIQPAIQLLSALISLF